MVLEVKSFPTDISLLVLKQAAKLISCHSTTLVVVTLISLSLLRVTMTPSIDQHHLQGCQETVEAMVPLF